LIAILLSDPFAFVGRSLNSRISQKNE